MPRPGKRKLRKAREVTPAVQNPKESHDSELNAALQASLQQYKADTAHEEEKTIIRDAIRKSKREYKSNIRAQRKQVLDMEVFVCTMYLFDELKFHLQCKIQEFLAFEENKILKQIIFRLDPPVQKTNKIFCHHAAAGNEWLERDLLRWQHED